MRRRLTGPRFRLLALAAAAAGLFVLAAIFLPHSPRGIRAAVAGFGWAAPILFVALWAALTPALFSGTILAGAAGLLFGAALGTAVGVAGGTLGGLISFAIARRCGGEAFHQLAPSKLRRVEDRLSSRPLRSLLILRLMPGMPATWLNYGVGLTRVRARTFALANALGALPRTFIYAGLGGSLTHASPLLTILSLVLFVVLGLVGALAALAERRALRAVATP